MEVLLKEVAEIFFVNLMVKQNYGVIIL